LGFNSVVHASNLGKGCFVGRGAIVIGVNLADGKFVPHGALVDSQSKADALGSVPADLIHFNEEVVKYPLNLPKAMEYERNPVLASDSYPFSIVPIQKLSNFPLIILFRRNPFSEKKYIHPLH
jgi:hypothetical protein